MKQIFARKNASRQINFFDFLMALFLVFALQRMLMFFFGALYLFSFKPKTGDLLLGLLYDFSWCFILLLLAEFADQLKRIFKFLPKNFFKWTVSIVSLILLFFLDQYYLTASSLLSNMILMFNFDELLDLLAFGENVSILRTTWFLGLLLLFIFSLGRLFPKWSKTFAFKSTQLVLATAGIISLCLQDTETPNVYATNKSYYFIQSLWNHEEEVHQIGDVRFQDFKDLDPLLLGKTELDQYHLLRKEWEEKSELGQYFRKTSSGKAPNICIVVVESLSSSLVGQYAKQTGNVMPFLDSLSKKSLYFPNALSTAQRTHHVLPAIFASLPHTKSHTCLQEEDYPDHIGIAKMTKEHYYSSFYCGVGLDFNQMNRFVRYNDVDYESNSFTGVSSQERNEIKDLWGLPDHLMLREYIKELKKRQIQGKYKRKSALDVLLTISTHEPFNYPNKPKHIQAVKACLEKSAKTPFKVYLKSKLSELGSFHYADESLKSFFEQIKNTKDFENTIFIITGDHGSTLLYENEMSKYHVPMVIYSPLLKKSKTVPHLISHLDIAPTLMNFLRKDYNVEMPDEHYFLGNEIHLRRADKRALIFKGENLLVRDLVYNKFAYLDGKLFKLSHQMVPIPTNDTKELKRLKNQSRLMNLFNHYVVEQNHILPFRVHSQVISATKKISIKEVQKEFLTVFELHTKKWKGKDMLIDVDFITDSSITKTHPMVPIWIMSNDAFDNTANPKYKKQMWGRYVSNGNLFPYKCSMHCFISKEELQKMKSNQKLVCFIHNVNKEKLPFKKVIWKIQ